MTVLASPRAKPCNPTRLPPLSELRTQRDPARSRSLRSLSLAVAPARPTRASRASGTTRPTTTHAPSVPAAAHADVARREHNRRAADCYHPPAGPPTSLHERAHVRRARAALRAVARPSPHARPPRRTKQNESVLPRPLRFGIADKPGLVVDGPSSRRSRRHRERRLREASERRAGGLPSLHSRVHARRVGLVSGLAMGQRRDCQRPGAHSCGSRGRSPASSARAA